MDIYLSVNALFGEHKCFNSPWPLLQNRKYFGMVALRVQTLQRFIKHYNTLENNDVSENNTSHKTQQHFTKQYILFIFF